MKNRGAGHIGENGGMSGEQRGVNVVIIVPDGHRMIAHAVRDGATTLDRPTAPGSKVLPSQDLWALPRSSTVERCRACTSRHG
jgi:hypothetical protein